jgi:CheY-like chemotaxis protein
MEGAPLVILVAEDDSNDTFLLRRAFQKAGLTFPLHICKDGAEALDYLKGVGEFGDRSKFPFPRILITDLKMPRCSGFDLLRWLREHPDCSVIPTVVLSASAVDADVKLAYSLGANCYFCKPTSFDRLVDIVKLTCHFWKEAVLPELPKTC